MNNGKADGDTSKRRQELLEKRSELSARLEAIEKDYSRGLDQDSAERAVQLENAEVLNEIARVTALSTKAIDEELEQLDE
jgi:RNA polymerase-binding transcription factor DksA